MSDTAEQEAGKRWHALDGGIFGALASPYVFLVGLQVLGDSFKRLGSRGRGAVV